MKFISVADSSTVVTSEIDRVGPKSSSVMVKIAESSEILALVELERVIVAVSLTSSIESERVETVNVLDSSPAANMRVPLVAV